MLGTLLIRPSAPTPEYWIVWDRAADGHSRGRIQSAGWSRSDRADGPTIHRLQGKGYVLLNYGITDATLDILTGRARPTPKAEIALCKLLQHLHLFFRDDTCASCHNSVQRAIDEIEQRRALFRLCQTGQRLSVTDW